MSIFQKLQSIPLLKSGQGHLYQPQPSIWFEHKHGTFPSRQGCSVPSLINFKNVGAHKSFFLRDTNYRGVPGGLTFSAVVVLREGLVPNSRGELKLVLQLLRLYPRRGDGHALPLMPAVREDEEFERVGFIELEFATTYDYEASDWFLEAVEQDLVI
ncbi:hypothetical protein F4823DRAFT_612289, partial [Ustulina deusta]